ncbi:MAG: D-tyrosyl-tRNA(Tyr) deacylase [Deltaproteobacteria bacterium]|nr:D-tyrosyl-tRNA(Tyr) deacylase [Deltaproteobacteria bacterium]
MRAVIQRVSEAQVTVAGRTIGAIGDGLLVLLGVAVGDSERDLRYLVEKTIHLRIFDDENGKMNRSLEDTGGSVLVVSQFTLLADCRKGRRPSFHGAAPPAEGEEMYRRYVAALRALGLNVATGEFGAMMHVSLCNCGPVTIILDSQADLA